MITNSWTALLVNIHDDIKFTKDLLALWKSMDRNLGQYYHTKNPKFLEKYEKQVKIEQSLWDNRPIPLTPDHKLKKMAQR